MAVNIGVIGLGPAGCHHVERLSRRDDCRVMAAFDSDPAVAQRAPAQCPVVASLDEIFGNSSIELVIVATPSASHVELALAAVERGRHVLIEAPLALRTDDVDALVEAVRRTRRWIGPVPSRIGDEDALVARQLIENGTIEWPRHLKLCTWRLGIPVEADANRHDNWQANAGLGGGTLWQYGPHALEQLLSLVRSEPVSVFAMCDSAPSAPVVDTGFLAIIQFADGATAHLEMNRGCLPPLETGWMLSGSRTGYRKFTAYSLSDDGEVSDINVPREPAPPAVDHFGGIIAKIGREESPLAELQRSRTIVRLIEAAHMSAQESRVVSLR